MRRSPESMEEDLKPVDTCLARLSPMKVGWVEDRTVADKSLGQAGYRGESQSR